MQYSDENKTIIPVILSGGKGSRLWPLSRECHPKQYLFINDKSKHSLLQSTYFRLIGIEGLDSPLVICNEEQRFIVAEQLRKIEINPKSIILEPIGRNTAPAIALAALYALREGIDPVLLVLSSDHYIKDNKKFRTTINKGYEFANKGRLVTFGIIPTRPETGYGYIEAKDDLGENDSSEIKKFIEKPNKSLAKKLIENKCFTWNSGIFLFKASIIINEIKKYKPEIIEICKNSVHVNDKIFNFIRIDKTIFEKCPNIPIDIAVMEKTKLGTVLPLDAGWSDIGNWQTVWEESDKDSNGNFKKGKVLIKESNNCYVRSEERLIVGIGLKDIIIVETSDAVLVSHKDSTQSVKDVVKDLKENNFVEAKFNKKIFRPWGNYTSISLDKSWQVKRLEIKPSETLSLQLHRHRSEHWVVVKGIADVEIDGIKKILQTNESIFVPLGSKHRLSNKGNIPLVIIEIQTGEYLGEDDIERFDDIYGRINY